MPNPPAPRGDRGRVAPAALMMASQLLRRFGTMGPGTLTDRELWERVDATGSIPEHAAALRYFAHYGTQTGCSRQGCGATRVQHEHDHRENCGAYTRGMAYRLSTTDERAIVVRIREAIAEAGARIARASRSDAENYLLNAGTHAIGCNRYDLRPTELAWIEGVAGYELADALTRYHSAFGIAAPAEIVTEVR